MLYVKKDNHHGGYNGRVSYKSGNKTKIKYFHAPTRSAVMKKLEEFESQVRLTDGCCHSETDKILFSDFAPYWLETYKKLSMKPASFERLQEIYEHQLKDNIGSLAMNALSNMHVQNLINTLSEKYSYSTIKKVYQFIDACYRQYRFNYHVSQDPCRGVVMPQRLEKPTAKADMYYTAEQRAKIKETAKQTFKNGSRVFRMGDAVIVLLYTGMRIGELLALKWSDIDFEKHIIHVTKNALPLHVDNKLQMVDQPTPKTKSGKRDIPFGKTVEEAFAAIRKETGSGEYVMTTKNGTRIFPRNMDRMFRDICRHAGVPIHGVHALRHSFASMLYEKQCPEKTVSALLGHSDISTTMNIYVGMRQEQLAAAIQNIESFTD